MPIIKSARKRVRVAAKQSIQNAKTKRSMKESIKAFKTAVADKKDSTKLQSEAFSAVDTAVKKDVISKNRAARLKSQLNDLSKAAGTTKVGAKSAKATPKTAVKKTPVKKTAVKKPATKKATPKK
jgi:small subunit ribosomal protein S20